MYPRAVEMICRSVAPHSLLQFRTLSNQGMWFVWMRKHQGNLHRHEAEGRHSSSIDDGLPVPHGHNRCYDEGLIAELCHQDLRTNSKGCCRLLPSQLWCH